MAKAKKLIVNLEDLVQGDDEIKFLFKLKNQIMMSLLNNHRVRIPGLGIVELYQISSGNRFKLNTKKVNRIHVKLDEALEIKLKNQETPNE